jgi:hypothetical protein
MVAFWVVVEPLHALALRPTGQCAVVMEGLAVVEVGHALERRLLAARLRKALVAAAVLLFTTKPNHEIRIYQ